MECLRQFCIKPYPVECRGLGACIARLIHGCFSFFSPYGKCCVIELFDLRSSAFRGGDVSARARWAGDGKKSSTPGMGVQGKFEHRGSGSGRSTQSTESTKSGFPLAPSGNSGLSDFVDCVAVSIASMSGRHSGKYFPRTTAGRRHRRFRRHRRPAHGRPEGQACADRNGETTPGRSRGVGRAAGIGRTCEPPTGRTNRRGAPRGRRRGGRCRPGRGRRSPRRPRIRAGA